MQGIDVVDMDGLGSRIRLLRTAAKLSQDELGRRVRVSQPTVSKWETGALTITDKRTFAAVAGALGVTEAALLGKPMTGSLDPDVAAGVGAVPALRTVLGELAVGYRPAPARPLSDLVRAVTGPGGTDELRMQVRWGQLTPVLPGLLRDLAGHGSDGAVTLVRALVAARGALRWAGHDDLAAQAGEVGLRVAFAHGDPVCVGQAWFSRLVASPAGAAPAVAAAAERTAGALNPAAGDRDAAETYGLLVLQAGLQHAIAGDAGTSRERMGEALRLATSLGPPQRTGPVTAGVFGQWFSVPNVYLWMVAAAAELVDPGAALVALGKVDRDAIPANNRIVSGLLDVARVLAAGDGGPGGDERAVRYLGEALDVGPQHVLASPVARDVFATVAARTSARAVEPLVPLGRRLGLVTAAG